MRSFILRSLAAAILYGSILALLGTVHDYPQLRAHLQKVRVHDATAERRQWLTLFYLVNEAGSGMKYFMSGNERYMVHYPSPSHLLAGRKARALAGEWEMQMQVARMYYFGEFAPQDLAESLHWLYLAHDNAPSPEQAKVVAELISQISQQISTQNSPNGEL